MTTINLNQIGKATQKRIRDEVGVGNITQLKKLAKDSGVDLGKKKETQEKRAYEYFGTIINDRIEEQKALKAQEERIHKENIKQFKKNVRSGASDFSIRFKSIEESIKMMEYASTKGKYLLTNEDGIKFPLNGKTVEKLKSKAPFMILKEYDASDTGDQADTYYGWVKSTTGGSVGFSSVGSSSGYGLNSGGFFPFTHDLPIDLTEFQIGRVVTEELVEDNCFIHSLKVSGIVKDKIGSICCEIIGRDIPQRKLKEIAEKYNIYITVKKPQDGAKTTSKIVEYGQKENPHLNLALVEGHYFLIKEVPYTSYAIKNYELVKNKPKWNEFIKKDERKKRFITSYELVLLMKECGYFKPLQLTSELMKTIYSDKVINIDTLEEASLHSRPNSYVEKEEDELVNLCFDFETTTNGATHKPYMVHIYNHFSKSEQNGQCGGLNPHEIDKTFHGEDCAKQMFYYLTKFKKQFRLLAHNAGYDIRFIYQHLFCFSMINRSKFLLRGNGRFYYGKDTYMFVEIQDTYAIISSPLKSFGKMFQLDMKKEVMPYDLYTEVNVREKYIPIEKCICDEQEEFMKNCREWGCIYKLDFTNRDKDTHIDIIKYSQIYCRLDYVVLWQGYNKFKGWIKDICGLNIDYYVSSASIAHDYMLKEGVYEGTWQLSGLVREFIQRAMVGGRTMMAENKQNHIKNNVDDFDAVSLYPSAMERIGEIGGYLKGKPKIITNLSYDFLKQQDGYFVEILITEVNKHYKFPIMSKIGEVREFTNDMVNQIIVVDKFTLEDLIKFHKISFKIIKGYYYDEGRNIKIGKVIRYLFNKRKEEKKNKNPVEQIFKLIMNSAYGKTLLKPFDTESKYIKDLNEHTSKYFNHIKQITPLFNGTFKVDHYKSINEHFNNCFIGVEVLSMSKRIMNEVMCLAEDNGLNMYYQDTDSIHIDSKSVSVLAQKFKEEHNRELIGNDMGQFHTDFQSDTLKGDLVSIESIYLGKKCYIDKLSDGTGIDYHIRMKGVPTQSIEYYAKQNNMSVFEIYEDLLAGKPITFDLACGGTKCCFEFQDDLTIKSLYKFEREIRFGGNKKEQQKMKNREKRLKKIP